MNINFKVIGLTQLGIKPESIAQKTDALNTTRPSELLIEERKQKFVFVLELFRQVFCDVGSP